MKMRILFNSEYTALQVHGLDKLVLLMNLFIVALLAINLSGCEQYTHQEDIFHLAQQHKSDLQLSTYVTAHTIERLLSTAEGRANAITNFRANGITKVYLEVYRSGLIVDVRLMSELVTFFEENGFDVVGGIATVPGGDFGVAQEGKLGWFNWQNTKTQEDLRYVMTGFAPLFQSFIVDDFLCTGDTSLESKNAKGERSWSDYRRELLTNLASSVFINPAKQANSGIHMIIKYPQWYDRFHLFGYDVESGPALFDEVWVGTETRGQYTQRFGYVQPYEGFVNFRWIKSLAGEKTGGAWFDHGDCDQMDFVEQAWQSVLAGADELVLFSYDSFIEGHPGHELLRQDFEQLIALAKTVKENPVYGIPAYKPPHSDAGGDLYLMDFIGMFGIPLIPVSEYPMDAQTLFLPTQSATDPDIVLKIRTSLDSGSRVIFTAGFLAQVDDKGFLSELAGVEKPVSAPFAAESLLHGEKEILMPSKLDLESALILNNASGILSVKHQKRVIPFLTVNPEKNVYVLNVHTFSEADFEAVGEVLLCPRPLGLLELPMDWVNTIREVFVSGLGFQIEAPPRVTIQPLINGDMVIHNYNLNPVTVEIFSPKASWKTETADERIKRVDSGSLQLSLQARTRVWLKGE